MGRFIILAALALAACGESEAPAPQPDEELPESRSFAGEMDEQPAVQASTQGLSRAVVIIDFGASRGRSELRVELQGPLPDLVPLLRAHLALEPAFERDVDGRLALTALEGASALGDARWIVMLERAHRYTLLNDLAEQRLEDGDLIHLLLDTDVDADGVGARLERLYGTDDTRVDTDGDRLDDFSEIFGGWEVAAGHFVHSDPTRADTDGDGVDDGAERRDGTDPRHPD